MIDFEAYIEQTHQTAVYPDAGKGTSRELAYLALGLAGETGEVVDGIKKIFRSEGSDKAEEVLRAQEEHIKEEMGDIMWYFARLCHFHGWSMEDILRQNLQKLNIRLVNDTLVFRKSNDS